ncbi:copper chaperone [Parapedobacter sp.]
MKSTKSLRYSVSIVVLSLCSLAWMVLILNPGHIMTVAHCHITMQGPSHASLQMLLQMNPPSSMMAGWLLMVLAMMLPKLITPIQYICTRSLRRLRFRLALLFVSGYAAIWFAVGVVMNGVILGLNLLMPMSYVPALVVGIIALVWQFSPLKQRCLNRGHDHRPLAAFGWPAHRDALMFGAAHGLWCVGSGWALMLFPMLLHTGHNVAMLAVTFLMVSEHMEHPKSPRWYMDSRLKLLRIIIAQTRLKITRLTASRSLKLKITEYQ